MSTDEKEKLEEISLEEYKKEGDEEIEDKPIEEKDIEIDTKAITEIATAKNPLDDEAIKVDHFDDSTEEYLKKIAKMPVLGEEQANHFNQSMESKRQVWIMSHVDDDLYPIRFRVKEKDDPDLGIRIYKKKKVVVQGHEIDTFDTETEYFQYQSITPQIRDKVSILEQQESLLTIKLQKLQQKYMVVSTMRGLIDKALELDKDNSDDKKQISMPETKAYFKRLKEALDDLPKDFDLDIESLQTKIYESINKRTKLLMYGYLGMDTEKYEDVIFSDARDYLNVAQYRDKIKSPT